MLHNFHICNNNKISVESDQFTKLDSAFINITTFILSSYLFCFSCCLMALSFCLTLISGQSIHMHKIPLYITTFSPQQYEVNLKHMLEAEVPHISSILSVSFSKQQNRVQCYLHLACYSTPLFIRM